MKEVNFVCSIDITQIYEMSTAALLSIQNSQCLTAALNPYLYYTNTFIANTYKDIHLAFFQ